MKRLIFSSYNIKLLIVLGMVLIFCFSALQAAAREHATYEAPSSGELELITHSNGKAAIHRGVHLNSEAQITISGIVAEIKMTQVYKNDSPHWVEGSYVFPLPENAEVNAMEMIIGERVVKASIKEKQEAKRIYQQARDAGKKAGLLEQHRPNLFSQKVANIGPQETIIVKLRYLQTIDYRNHEFSLRLPMTITPRYIPGRSVQQDTLADNRQQTHSQISNEQAISKVAKKVNIDEQGWGWSQPTQQVPDAHLITPPMVSKKYNDAVQNPISVNIRLSAGLPLANIASPYHDIRVVKSAEQHTITLTNGTVSMDRDFVLNWRPVAQAQPTAAVFSESIDGEDYHLVMLMPPALKTSADHSINKDVIFIIDTSGSMGGTSIRQAKAGLQYSLKQLSPQDRFNIIEFNSNFSLYSNQPVPADSNAVHKALRFVERLQADGGTEILPALQAAFQQNHDPSFFKQIIFITDGSIGNEDQLFGVIHQQLNDARLFTVGIGSAPNSYFMRKAAEFGRGSFTYIGDVNEVNNKIAALFEFISKPTMRDLRLELQPVVPVGKQDHDIFPKRLADLYQGEPLMLSLKKNYTIKSLQITGSYQGRAWQQQLALTKGKNHPGIASLWGQKKIESLLDEERGNRNTSGSERAQIKAQIIEVALEHQLMSPYTSFVAVEEKISRPHDQNLKQFAVANLVAQGQTFQSIPYPQGATPLWLNLLLGLAAVIALLLLQRAGRSCNRV